MRITNEKYVACPKCRQEASGLEQINQRFGYMIKGEDVTPYRYCRDCRKQMEAEKPDIKSKRMKDTNWASAASWGRKIHINRRVFDSYLVDLGYLEKEQSNNGRYKKLIVTRAGEQHSALTNNPFRQIILWDYDTFTKVMKLRAEKADVHYCCEKCSAPVDEAPDFNHLQLEYRCDKCGHVGDVYAMSVVFDR